jgi:hypothetical protein
MQLSFITVVPKYLNLATSVKDMLHILISSVYPASSSWDMHVYLVFFHHLLHTTLHYAEDTTYLKNIQLSIDCFLSYLIFSHCNCTIFFEMPIMVTSRNREYTLWKTERSTVLWGTICEDQNINKHLRFEDLSRHQKTRPLFLSVFLRKCRVCTLIRK